MKMFYIAVIIAFLPKFLISNEIVQYQYWLNSDFSQRVIIDIDAIDTSEVELQLNIDSLLPGFHFIHMMFMDSNGIWSPPIVSYFLIPYNFQDSTENTITACEYWFNNDFENRVNVEVQADDTLTLNQMIDVSHLLPGFHFFRQRFKSSGGIWSPPESFYFLIPYQFDTVSNYSLVEYDYWFDDDFDNRNTISISESDSIDLLKLIDVSHLCEGLHTLGFRFRTDTDFQIAPLRQYFFNPVNFLQPDSSNYLLGLKYWFDGDTDKYYIYYHDSLAYELNIEQDIDVDNIIGNRTIFIHAIDSAGYQSLPITFDFTNSFSYVVDKNVVTFDVPEIAAYQYSWNFGDGNTSTLPNPTHVYKKGGTFDVRLILTRGTPSIKDTLIEQVTITLVTNEILLSQGWNMISTYVIPDEFDIDSIFSEIGDNTVIMKNNAGQIYYPAFGINDIGDWDMKQGYQVYMNQSDTLSILGVQIIPENETINLSSGWNMIAYLRDSPMDIELALASLTDDDNLLIAKDNFGNVYYPAFEINMIGNMLPGQGYQIFILNSDTLVYPEN
ncbi:MAG: PKD domain-containing protein [Candidatus Kapabacteria bacterium]|nr:PKD domain-containing protein [Candidatus Kapabacteria bacterium]